MALWPIPDIGPLECEPPSAMEVAILRGAAIAFMLAYPAASFLAHRVTCHPWIVFAAMLAPVLVFGFDFACSPPADFSAEQWAWTMAYFRWCLRLV